MAQPILKSTPAFDASLEHLFSFTYIGNQVFAHQFRVYDNTTNVIVYNKKVESFQTEHTIPANSLKNGVLYRAQVSVFDKNGVESSLSQSILFYCYSIPTFQITNLTENQIVRSSSYQVELFYSQPQGELLNSYQVFLYNQSHSQIWSSNLLYNTESMYVTLSDLTDSSQYYVRATGITINGMEIDTGYLPFSVLYVQPSLYAITGLKNLREQGMIKITSNIKIITGSGSGGHFIDEKKYDVTAIKIPTENQMLEIIIQRIKHCYDITAKEVEST